MSFVNNKKGLAEIILVTLVILLSSASIALFSAAIFSPAKNLSPAISCTELSIEKPLSIKQACIIPDKEEIKAALQRPLGSAEIGKIIFRAVNSDGEKEEWCCGGSQCPQCIIQQEGSEKTYSLSGVQMQNPELLIIEVEQCVLESAQITECGG